MDKHARTKANGWALVPVFVFLAIYMTSSLMAGDFYKMPLPVAFLVAAVVGVALNRKRSLNEKIQTFMTGMGNPNIMMMCAIFILAGAFASTARAMGAVDATVNLGLQLLPGNLLLAGVFVIACFISLSVGTSVGTVVALAPMAIGISDQAGIQLGLALGAVMGGAMFGDNLSMISDTTIAATRTQGCKMNEKFKVNFFIVLPAALVCLVIYSFTSVDSAALVETVAETNLWKVIPYLFVLIVALLGVNVMIVLFSGTLLAGIVGLLTHSFDGWAFLQSMHTGVMGMSEIMIISMLVGGMVELIKVNGGIQFLLEQIGRRSKSRRGAEFSIAALTGVINFFTANNTIAILMAGPIVKDLPAEYDIPPRRAASIMDTFSCFVQGMLPYGAQLLAAVGIAGAAAITPIEIMKYLYYPYIMGAAAILAIIFNWPRLKKPAA